MVEAVIFDMDGTLLDFELLSHEALNFPLQSRFGDKFEFTWKWHAENVGRRARGPEGWSALTLEHLNISKDEFTPEEYATEVEKYLKPKYNELHLMSGALDLFKRYIDEDIPIAIATSSSREATELKLAKYPTIRNNLSALVCGDDKSVKRGKPNPDIFIEAAKELGVSKNNYKNILVFEDSPAGVSGAKSAGMISIAVPDQRLFKSDSVIRKKFSNATIVLKRGLNTFTKFKESTLF